MLEQLYQTARVFICVMAVFTLFVCHDRKLVGFEQTWAARSWVSFQWGLLFAFSPAILTNVSPFHQKGVGPLFEVSIALATALMALAMVVQLVARAKEGKRHKIVLAALGVWLIFSFVVVFL